MKICYNLLLCIFSGYISRSTYNNIVLWYIASIALSAMYTTQLAHLNHIAILQQLISRKKHYQFA